MDDPEFDKLERELGKLPQAGAAPALRETVLADVRRELRAARWDRRLARAAVILFVIGVGLNATLARRAAPAVKQQLSAGLPNDSLAQVAVAVAESTDDRTGRRFAHELAALTGKQLGREELAAIDAAIERRGFRPPRTGKEG